MQYLILLNNAKLTLSSLNLSHTYHICHHILFIRHFKVLCSVLHYWHCGFIKALHPVKDGTVSLFILTLTLDVLSFKLTTINDSVPIRWWVANVLWCIICIFFGADLLVWYRKLCKWRVVATMRWVGVPGYVLCAFICYTSLMVWRLCAATLYSKQCHCSACTKHDECCQRVELF